MYDKLLCDIDVSAPFTRLYFIILSNEFDKNAQFHPYITVPQLGVIYSILGLGTLLDSPP